jgi:IS30 family transposase
VARLGRPGGLSEAGKKELLERWKAGESISDISRALKKPPGSIHGMLKAQGGIAPPHGRSSRFVMLVRLGGKDTESVVAALGEQIRRLPRTMIDTLTWDRGTEMAAHKSFTVATDVAVYFCDPKSPWQSAPRARTQTGSSGSTCPQRPTYLCVYDQTDLDQIALKLNTRPRKTLGYSTPAATLAETVALTG